MFGVTPANPLTAEQKSAGLPPVTADAFGGAGADDVAIGELAAGGEVTSAELGSALAADDVLSAAGDALDAAAEDSAVETLEAELAAEELLVLDLLEPQPVTPSAAVRANAVMTTRRLFIGTPKPARQTT
jgi:hypothetical protein